MAFNNPWGKGSKKHDRWFKNLWSPSSASIEDAFPTTESWEVKTSETYSSDNQADMVVACRNAGWPDLGVNINPSGWGNAIEIQINIKDHKHGFSYNIKRSKEFVIWQKFDDGWQKLELSPENRGVTDDDGKETDEYVVTIEDKTTGLFHIYDTDRPGTGGKFWTPGAKIYSLTANFIESLEITRDVNTEVSTDPKTQNWYSRVYVYIDHDGQGGRRMDESKSMIAAGTGSFDEPTD